MSEQINKTPLAAEKENPIISVRWITKRGALFHNLMMFYRGLKGRFPDDAYELRNWLDENPRLPVSLCFFRAIPDDLISRYYTYWYRAINKGGANDGK